jgi:hypothetical protein
MESYVILMLKRKESTSVMVQVCCFGVSAHLSCMILGTPWHVIDVVSGPVGCCTGDV